MATFLSKERGKILTFILDNPEKRIEVREVARRLKLSPSHVSRTLKILCAQGIIKNGKVDLSKPYARSWKIFLNTQKLIEKNAAGKLKKLGAKGVGVYGSYANGTNREDSDIDIWIDVEKNPGEIRVASVSSEIRAAMNKNIQILVLAPERIERLKKEDPIFYYSLVFGSFMLQGEAIE